MATAAAWGLHGVLTEPGGNRPLLCQVCPMEPGENRPYLCQVCPMELGENRPYLCQVCPWNRGDKAPPVPGLLKDPSAGTWVKVFISLDCKLFFGASGSFLQQNLEEKHIKPLSTWDKEGLVEPDDFLKHLLLDAGDTESEPELHKVLCSRVSFQRNMEQTRGSIPNWQCSNLE
ncbi:hypothetical protein HGM15179_002871 [Zosterops borbonicus]|uniref:Uncharacterized protein n=1 Tax=Zosterops borbonicus TaxID=364589 RepID=A0A8K1LRK3_9PASS|nr:hypothetical protein HGM15179_002871 [Zosterops borbonicus]